MRVKYIGKGKFLFKGKFYFYGDSFDYDKSIAGQESQLEKDNSKPPKEVVQPKVEEPKVEVPEIKVEEPEVVVDAPEVEVLDVPENTDDGAEIVATFDEDAPISEAAIKAAIQQAPKSTGRRGKK